MTRILYKFPKGGIAPVSQSGKLALKSASAASSTDVALAADFNIARSTCRDAGTTAIANAPSILTITVFANSLPGICAKAAIPCAVYATEWDITMYLICLLSRKCFSVVSDIDISFPLFQVCTPSLYYFQ